LWLGATTNNGRRFDGKIGEVLIYETALTPGEFARKLSALGKKWIDIERDVTVRVTVSAELDGGGECECSTVDVFIDDVLVGASLRPDDNGAVVVTLSADGCGGEDEHVLSVTCRSSFGDQGGSGSCTFSCPVEQVEVCDNEVDDDDDGLVDCADDDCAEAKNCQGTPFIRGDADDNSRVELTDAVQILGFLFQGLPAPGCFDAADADDNGGVELTDAVRILGFLFQGTAPPPAPGPVDCGEDPAEPVDALDCAESSCP
jgi:hypothetical protein